MTLLDFIRAHEQHDSSLGDLAYALEDVAVSPATLHDLQALAEPLWGTLPGSARKACYRAWTMYKRFLGYAGEPLPRDDTEERERWGDA